MSVKQTKRLSAKLNYIKVNYLLRFIFAMIKCHLYFTPILAPSFDLVVIQT